MTALWRLFLWEQMDYTHPDHAFVLFLSRYIGCMTSSSMFHIVHAGADKMCWNCMVETRAPEVTHLAPSTVASFPENGLYRMSPLFSTGSSMPDAAYRQGQC